MKLISSLKVISLASVVLGSMLVVATGCKPADNGATASNSDGSKGGSSTAVRPAVTGKGVTVTGDTITIGVVGSLSGNQKPWGVDEVDGAKLALADFEAAGGIPGKKIKLDIQDSASQAQGAKTATDKCISDGAVSIVGEVSSGNTQNIATEAYAASIPDVAVGATKTTLTDVGNNVFRVCYTDDLQGPVMARFAYQERGMRNMAIMTDKAQPYSQGLSASFKDEFTKLGGKIVDEESYQTGDSNFSAQLTKIKAAAPDGIFMSGYFPEVGPIAAAARQSGIQSTFFGGDGWDSPQILKSGGTAIIGSFMANHYNNKEDRPEVKTFLKEWAAAHGGQEPGTTMGALGYDAMMLTLQSLKKTPSLNSVDLIKTIDSTTDFDGVSGKIDLAGYNGNPPKRVLVVEIRPQSEGFQVFRKAYDTADLKSK